ncbi:MAG TPA: zinc-dependent peptidase [Usitatibacter sp.]|jgi:hypothetical protein|nr:zinc-dependent peptidase [Usitatibacter sp.]
MLLTAFLACAGLAGWFLVRPALAERRREKLRALAFPPQWREWVERYVPYAASLPRDLRWQLEKHVRVFVSEKRFVGLDGLRITDEIRVAIAAHACLLALNRGTEIFPNVRRIRVYPGMPGTSSRRGTVVLSWEDVLEAAGARGAGRNAVIREFAAQVDSGLQADFVATVSETFFEKPREMATLQAPVYEKLRRLYRLDPAHWSPDRRRAAGDA